MLHLVGRPFSSVSVSSMSGASSLEVEFRPKNDRALSELGVAEGGRTSSSAAIVETEVGVQLATSPTNLWIRKKASPSRLGQSSQSLFAMLGRGNDPQSTIHNQLNLG
jgi:hypothetical protein